MGLRILWKLDPAPVLKPVPVAYTLPAISFEHDWEGYSIRYVVAEIGNTVPFTLETIPDPPEEWFGVLAISWWDEVEEITHRYKFTDEGVLHYPVYSGEAIGPSAIFELWSAEEGDVAFAEYTVRTKTIAEYIDYSCSQECPDDTLVPTELVWYAPTALPPYSYTNPFYQPLLP